MINLSIFAKHPYEYLTNHEKKDSYILSDSYPRCLAIRDTVEIDCCL